GIRIPNWLKSPRVDRFARACGSALLLLLVGIGYLLFFDLTMDAMGPKILFVVSSLGLAASIIWYSYSSKSSNPSVITSSKNSIGAAMAQDKPTNSMGDIVNNQGIITQGQNGNNYILQFKSPEVRMLEPRKPVQNSDGSFTLELAFRLESQALAH